MNLNTATHQGSVNNSMSWIDFMEGSEDRLDKWIVFHRENPQVWELFEHYALQAASSGKRCYGARAILERARWDLSIQTKSKDFKINNNHIPYYARLFLQLHPELDHLFRTRKRLPHKRRKL